MRSLPLVSILSFLAGLPTAIAADKPNLGLLHIPPQVQRAAATGSCSLNAAPAALPAVFRDHREAKKLTGSRPLVGPAADGSQDLAVIDHRVTGQRPDRCEASAPLAPVSAPPSRRPITRSS